MTVSGAFVYVCKRGRVIKDYIARFPRGPQRPCYNGVAVYWEFLLLKIERVRQRLVLLRLTQNGFLIIERNLINTVHQISPL